MAALTRTAWVPVTKKGNSELLASRFGGLPALPTGTEHPRCKACHADMPLFVQLNIDSLPADARSQCPDVLHGKLLQFFYCTNDECNNQDFGAFAGNMLVRFVAVENTQFEVSDSEEVFLPKVIEAWKAVSDVPYLNEAYVHVHLDEDQKLADDYDDYCNALIAPLLHSGDKLLGWPDWIQDVSYPNCAVCGKTMQYLVQIRSKDNVDYMFGDAGIGHICVCPKHIDKPSFYWSCT
ncbi:MAG: DUF1963 domain-containing protein [Phycisphaerales bacterium]